MDIRKERPKNFSNLPMKERWEIFNNLPIRARFFDFDRTKTLGALQKLWERMPQDDKDKLPGDFIVFARSAEKLGEVFSLCDIAPDAWGESAGAFIYFSPVLERMSQAEVNSTVAHEFAHVVLGSHHSDYSPKLRAPVDFKTMGDLPCEQDADELITRWGFVPAYESNRRRRAPATARKRISGR